MKVLLTGASGFLGRYVLQCLEQHGIEVVTMGRRQAPDSQFAQFIETDLLANPDFAALVKQADATHLLHLAWYAEHGKYWTSPLNLRWVDATVRLVEAFCATGGKHVVAAGTCAEYDWLHGYCLEDNTPQNPATLYGVAKDAARRLTIEICKQHQVTCCWGRVFLPFGAGEASVRLIPSLIDVFQGTRSAFGVNAAVYRDFLHASDVAEGFFALLRCEASGVFNISSGQPLQLRELVQALAMQLNADPELVLRLTTQRTGEPPLLVGANLKLKALSWQPAQTLAQGLAQTLREAIKHEH